jgi:DNA-binding MarR family transcriptional regulator
MKRYIPLVREFAARVVLFHEAVAARVGLHVTDVKVLRLLGDEGFTPGQLIDHTGLTGAAVTALVDRLEAAGYVTRERDEQDRRRVTVRVVPARVRKIDRLYDSYSVDMSKILGRYGAAEFAVIESFLMQATQLLAEQAAALREPTGEASRKQDEGRD